LLSKVFRLKNKAEFQKVYQDGKSITTPVLVLSYFKNQQKNNPRIGFAVARKIGTAVCRNRVKRQMREAVKPYINAIDPAYDIIFIARMKIKGISVRDVEKNMLALLKRAQLLNRNE